MFKVKSKKLHDSVFAYTVQYSTFCL